MSAAQKSRASGEMCPQCSMGKHRGSSLIIRAFSSASSWWKGRWPLRSMYVATPSAHISTDESYGSCRSVHSSGAMYDGVPMWSNITSSPGLTALANPKSMSLSSASSRSSS